MASVVNTSLHGLQLAAAIIVIGTAGYGIHLFKPRPLHTGTPFGELVTTEGVPASWGFLIFCAVWTLLGSIAVPLAGARLAGNKLIGWTCVVVEVVALASWFAAFIAVAVNLASDICPAQHDDNTDCCKPVTVAAVFGAFEWLLFVVTTALTVRLLFSGGARAKTSVNGSGI